MTDQELDRLLRRALLDAADQEAQTPPETETPLSEGHRRRMREILRDPLLWFRLRNPYPWRTVARRAAVVLLMLSLSAAMVLAVSPKARADIIRWTMQQDGRRVEFRYHGDGPAQALPQYRIAALPEGYTETERAASYAAGDVKYTNADGDMILLSYLYMSDGVVSGFEAGQWRHHDGHAGEWHTRHADRLVDGGQFLVCHLERHCQQYRVYRCGGCR